MAVGTMSASLLTLAVLGCFLQMFSQAEVFRGAPGAHAVFLRPKRANQFLVEEILQGNLERECNEERCNFEEAREVFEDLDQTVAFWTIYIDGDQCDPNPCLNGGNCTDKVGGFSCSCPASNHGSICELGGPTSLDGPNTPGLTTPIVAWKGGAYKARHHEMSECPTEGPTACHQLCTAAYDSFVCSCMSGFKLQSDGRSCLPEVDFPCGRLPDATVSDCRHGNCPWQVSLTNSRGVELCGGVVLGRRSILTTASCIFLNSGSDLRPSLFYVTSGNRTPVQVQALYLHERFSLDCHDYDLALLQLATPLMFSPTLIQLCLPTKDFSENILMNSGRTGVVDKRGHGQNQDLVYMTLEDCRSQLNVSHQLSNKMFCMSGTTRPGGPKVQTLNQTSPNVTVSSNRRKRPGNHRRPDDRTLTWTPNLTQNRVPGGPKPSNATSTGSGSPCGGSLLGSPVATVEQGTAFLTGLLMTSSSGCEGQVFLKVSRYLNWIGPKLKTAEEYMTPQTSQYPKIH